MLKGLAFVHLRVLSRHADVAHPCDLVRTVETLSGPSRKPPDAKSDASLASNLSRLSWWTCGESNPVPIRLNSTSSEQTLCGPDSKPTACCFCALIRYVGALSLSHPNLRVLPRRRTI